MDQRVEQLEKHVSYLLSTQQQIVKRIVEIYSKLASLSFHHKEGENSNHGKHLEGRGSHSGLHLGSGHSYAPRLKLNFPWFIGIEDPTSWICWVEQFFWFHDTTGEDEVALASFHLEGKAQLWYQLL